MGHPRWSASTRGVSPVTGTAGPREPAVTLSTLSGKRLHCRSPTAPLVRGGSRWVSPDQGHTVVVHSHRVYRGTPETFEEDSLW